MPSPSVYDHLRPIDADHPDGTYRVVGTGEDAVTLLRVADADGHRIHTGELLTVARGELDGFDRVVNPDGNRPPRAAVADRLETVYWSARVFLAQLATHPLATAAALALLVIGSLDGRLPIPDALAGASILAGSLGLAYVGSGRL